MTDAAPGDPRVGVTVLTHDRYDDVARTVAQLRALPECPPIVVVDNASTDGTAARLAARFPDVEVVALADNRGAAGRNVGLARLRTPYVALCDDDTWWEPGALRCAADLLDAYPRLAVVTARVLVGAEECEDPTCAVMATTPLGLDPAVPGFPILGFLAGASVVRRAACLGAGGFDPRLFLGGEEILVAVDLATAGWAMAYVPELVVHHHPSSRRDRGRRRRLLVRNGLWFAWLRRPAASALRQTARALLTARGDAAALQGCVEAVGGLAWVLRERRVVPGPIEQALRRLDAVAARPGRARHPASATRRASTGTA